MKGYEHILHATNERLAEMLEEHNTNTATELGAIIEEAARRLRAIGKSRKG